MGLHVNSGYTVFWGLVSLEDQRVTRDEFDEALREAGFDFEHHAARSTTTSACVRTGSQAPASRPDPKPGHDRRPSNPIILRRLDRNVVEPLRHVLGVPLGLLGDDEDAAAGTQGRATGFQEEPGNAKAGIVRRICHDDVDASPGRNEARWRCARP